MPITTPEAYAKQFNDADHFIHVLEYLFVPALKKGNYEVVSPISVGSELIHAAIIKNLEQCDLVLCDISGLNPNVFFELGIRTSLDKPVVLVKDSLTPAIPFDTSSINALTYDAGLRPWLLKSEIERLVEHISTTEARSDGRNPLWRFFGLTQPAEPALVDDPVEAKLDLLMAEISELKRVSKRSPYTVINNYETDWERAITSTGVAYANNPYPMNGGTVWAGTPVVAYNNNLVPIDSAPQEYQNFTRHARTIAAREGASLIVEGYDSAAGKLIINSGNWPMSERTIKEISTAGQKFGVDYELRGSR